MKVPSTSSSGVVVTAAVADGVPEEPGGDPAAGAAPAARVRARRAARHALARRPLQAQEGGARRHQGRTDGLRNVMSNLSTHQNMGSANPCRKCKPEILPELPATKLRILQGWGRYFEKVSKDTDTVLTDIHMC